MKKAIITLMCALAVIYITIAILMLDFGRIGSNASSAGDNIILQYKIVDGCGEFVTNAAGAQIMHTQRVKLYKNDETGIPETRSSKKVTLARANAVVYPGHSFRGNWFINGGEFKPGDRVPAGLTGNTQDVLSYLSDWAVNTYKISFHPNGGSPTPSSQWVRFGEEYGDAITASTGNVTRLGHNFAGWWTTRYSGGIEILANDIVAITENTTLYARWTPMSGGTVTKYSINFHGNGHTGGTMASQSANVNTPITLNANAFVRTSHTFRGWATSAGRAASGIVDYADKATITGCTPINLWAVWQVQTQSQQVTVTFTASGATHGTQTFTKGASQILSGGIPYRSGYTFLCWNSNSGGTGTDYHNGSSYTFNANTQLWAVWTKATPQHTLTFIANSVQFNSQVYNEGVAVKLNAGIPQRAGYTFLCWNTNSSGTGCDYYNGSSYYMDGITTLWAVWIRN